jgi:hypothetical protein
MILKRYNFRALLQEVILSRVINPDNVGKERARLAKGVVLAIRELAQQKEPGLQSRDLVAFIALALDRISKTIDITVAPWEKRDYWIKADKFRTEWYWSGSYARDLKRALLDEDWENIIRITTLTGMKLSKIKVTPRHRLGQPWIGAWNELRKK